MQLSKETIANLLKKFPPEHPVAELSQMVTLNSSKVNWDDWSHEKYLTCLYHPFSRYVTKHYWERSLHFIQGPNGLIPGVDEECDCSASHLRVVLPNGS